ncbi:MAG: hypothetical protein IJ043_05405 [Clostridia bacterium]|nr:hypothetical protein [Clostridia bacterium]
MLYKQNKGKELDMALFQKPTSEYRGTPFWAWNCKLDPDQIRRQVDYFKEMGFGGFHMHCRVGLATPYLSEEFMDCIKACVTKAKDEQMLAWLYDEDRWASGAAGGFVTKEKKFRLKNLKMSTTRPAEFLDKTTAFDMGKPYFLAAYDIQKNEEGVITAYRRVGIDEEAVGTKWYASVHTAADNPWFNNQAYPDTMDEETMQRFIEVTYQAYHEAVGEDFDGVVPAIFTDEPNFLCREKNVVDKAASDDEISCSWSRFFEEKYSERYGEDILDRVPEIFWLTADGRDTEIKYRFYDFCAERFAICFADQCGKWCEEHGLALTGHILREESLEKQVPATGDNMRQYRSFTIPGIDMLCDNVELTTAKQCQSVVHQMGKEAMLSELYGVTNWDFDFRGHKFQGDWQAALGVTVRVPHLSWMSMAGEAKRDYPASIFYQSAWYKEYPYLEDHFSRLNTVLTRGTPEVRVGLIHPVESYWILYGPNDQTGEARRVLDENFKTVTKWLLEGHQDFNYVNESLLAELQDAAKPHCVGQMEYDAIVVPDCRTLRTTTLNYLDQFMEKGGKVIFMSGCPAYVDGVKSDAAKAVYEKATCISFNKTDVIEALECCRRVDIRKTNGLPAERYLYQMRKDGADQWLFVAPFQRPDRASTTAQREDTGAVRGEKIEITVAGTWQPNLYDTLTGKVLPISFRHVGNKTVILHEMFVSDSLLIKLSAPHYHEFIQEKAERFVVARRDYKQLIPYTRSEENVLLLDVPEFKLDDEPWNPREEILRLDNQLRDRLGYPSRREKFAQPWVVPDDPAEHTASVRYTVNSAIKVKGAKLALEDAEKATILVNGKPISNEVTGWYVDEAIKTVALPDLKKGINTIEITLPFAKRANLEACYLLGNFDVKVQGTETVIVEPSHLLGFGSIAAQGLPFYGGNITYELPLEVPADCDVELHIGKYKGALCKVALDDGEAVPLAFSPYNVSFKKVQKGSHTLKVTVFGHRFNTFGCVHNCDEQYSWFGPDCWRTVGDRWSYEYQLKEIGLLISPKVVMYQ